MEKTKIQLSTDELLLMQNSDWILTKNSVIEKISQGLGSLVLNMQRELVAASLIEETIILSSPKISRGEKYQGLPYVMLDYPRLFGREDILAIRTLFWWGNYCSITLHVKGGHQELISARIISDHYQLGQNSFYISFSGNEWNHNMASDDYKTISTISQQELGKILSGTGFLKLTAKVEIGPWDEMEKRLFELFLRLAEFIKV
ncbi:MAG: hypothetical protein ABIN89_18180 [Chitinophagaceae bacterium]